jgi:hypothetical protein
MDGGGDTVGEATPRVRPNILVTGTPGTGKSITCELLTELTKFRYTNVGEVIRTHGFHAGQDEHFDTFILDEDSEDQLLDFMEDIMARSTCIQPCAAAPCDSGIEDSRRACRAHLCDCARLVLAAATSSVIPVCAGARWEHCGVSLVRVLSGAVV